MTIMEWDSPYNNFKGGFRPPGRDTTNEMIHYNCSGSDWEKLVLAREYRRRWSSAEPGTLVPLPLKTSTFDSWYEIVGLVVAIGLGLFVGAL